MGYLHVNNIDCFTIIVVFEVRYIGLSLNVLFLSPIITSQIKLFSCPCFKMLQYDTGLDGIYTYIYITYLNT